MRRRWRRQVRSRPEPGFVDAVLETAPDAMLVVAGDGRIVLANRQAELLLGWGRDQLLGQSVDMLVPPHSRGVHPGRRGEFSRDPTRRPMGAGLELAALRADGSEVPVDISLSPLERNGEQFVSVALRDVTDRQAAAAELLAAHNRLRDTVSALERHRAQLELTNEMGDLLQGCQTVDDAYDVVAVYADRFFPGSMGAIYRPGENPDLLEQQAAWPASARATSTTAGPLLPVEECWALALGRSYCVLDDRDGLRCRHLSDVGDRWSVCIPVIAQGEVLGLLVTVGTSGAVDDAASVRRIATSLADHLSLAIANLRLRETLRSQSIRDHLTGLYNRRFQEEHLAREILRAQRSGTTIGVLAIDLDHFKAFNDTLGHAAGDAALVAVSRLLVETCRGEDIACRQGGEEFLVVLPGADEATCTERADLLRERCAALPLGDGATITMSVGVAVFPIHGDTSQDLLRAADGALYAAKRSGRNATRSASVTRVA